MSARDRSGEAATSGRITSPPPPPGGRERFRRRSPRELVLAAEAAAALALLRLGLALVPFARVLKWVERWATRGRNELSDGELAQRMWAVSAAGRRVAPAGPCLPQALLALAILRHARRPAELRIGVRSEGRPKGEDGSPGLQLLAHAWVESEGRVIMGGADAPARYASFPPVSGNENGGTSGRSR